MRITRKSYPGLVPRIWIWVIIIGIAASISIFRHRMGEVNTQLAATVVIIVVSAWLVVSLSLRQARRHENRPGGSSGRDAG
jgi:hypothetical protein